MKQDILSFEELTQRKYGGYVFQLVENRKLSLLYHSHNFYEVIFIIRGSAIHKVNSASYIMEAGDGIILTQGDRHCFTEQSEDLLLIGLSVESNEFMSFSEALDVNIGAVKAEFKIKNTDIILSVCKEIEYGHTYIQNLRLLLGHFLTACHGNTSEVSSSVKRRLDEALAEIRKEHSLMKGLPEFIRLSSYSYPHLYRLTKEYYGKTPHGLIFELKMETAYKKLIFSDESISNIGEELGFKSLSHFCHIFKKHYGSSPSEIRKKHIHLSSV